MSIGVEVALLCCFKGEDGMGREGLNVTHQGRKGISRRHLVPPLGLWGKCQPGQAQPPSTTPHPPPPLDQQQVCHLQQEGENSSCQPPPAHRCTHPQCTAPQRPPTHTDPSHSLQQRRELLPGHVQLVVADEQPPVAVDAVQDQALIGICMIIYGGG